MSEVRLTHIGGPTVLIEIDGWRLLTDPTFDPPGGHYGFGWGTASDKVTGPAIPATEIGPLDAVLLTHDGHADNLDERGRRLLPSAGAVITTVAGARRLGGHARGLPPWGTTTIEQPGRPRLRVTATPCRHGPPLSRRLVGDVVGFALRLGDGGDDDDGNDDDEVALWVSGDTVLYGGLLDAARRLSVDTALLHLGGARFPITGALRYSMTAGQAVSLCRLLRPRVAFPVHYEGWSHFAQGRAAIEQELARAPADVRDRFAWLPLGSAVVTC